MAEEDAALAAEEGRRRKGARGAQRASRLATQTRPGWTEDLQERRSWTSEKGGAASGSPEIAVTLQGALALTH